MKMLRTAACAAALTISTIHAAFAVDGQIDVAPDGATPYVISAPGAYVLVKNVTMTANVDCIQITASNVTLDLNGHTIAGTGAGAAADGVDLASNSDITVRNGAIRNFGSRGISGAGSGIRIDEIAATGCLDVGIMLTTGTSHHVSNSSARENTSYGIHVGGSSRIENCLASGNNKLGVTSGIVLSGPGSIVVNSIANNNKPSGTGSGVGILAVDNSTIQNCTANANSGTTTGDGKGISTTANCSISNCLTDGNLGAGTGKGVGILVANSSRVTDSVATNNKAGTSGNGIGISAGSKCVVRNNTCTGNFSGSNSGIGIGIFGVGENQIQENFCSGNRGVGSGSGYGINLTAENNTIAGNIAFDNTALNTGQAVGISAGFPSQRVVGNTCNKNVSQSGDGFGILSGGRSIVDSNVCDSNWGTSAAITAGIGVADNTIVTNNLVDSTFNSGAGYAVGIAGAGWCQIENNAVFETRGGGISAAISATADSTIRGNLCSDNGSATSTVTYGITVTDRCTIENNTASFNVAGTEAYGIFAKTLCLVQNNHLEENDSKNSAVQNFGTGINVDGGSVVRFNVASGNSAVALGYSAGIIVEHKCVVEGNTVIDNFGAGNSGSNGISVIGFNPGRTLVRANYASGNTTSINFTGQSGNRSELNRVAEPIIYGGTPVLAGDLADVTL